MQGVRLIPDKQMNRVVAHQRGVVNEVDTTATQIGQEARANLARHRDEGNAKIEVEHGFPGKYGSIDALVSLVDEPHMRADGSWSAGNAFAIEFGHWHNHKPGVFVDGLYVLSLAARLI